MPSNKKAAVCLCCGGCCSRYIKEFATIQIDLKVVYNESSLLEDLPPIVLEWDELGAVMIASETDYYPGWFCNEGGTRPLDVTAVAHCENDSTISVSLTIGLTSPVAIVIECAFSVSCENWETGVPIMISDCPPAFEDGVTDYDAIPNCLVDTDDVMYHPVGCTPADTLSQCNMRLYVAKFTFTPG